MAVFLEVNHCSNRVLSVVEIWQLLRFVYTTVSTCIYVIFNILRPYAELATVFLAKSIKKYEPNLKVMHYLKINSNILWLNNQYFFLGCDVKILRN